MTAPATELPQPLGVTRLAEVLAGLAHPTRLVILLTIRDTAAKGPVAIAKVTDMTLGDVSYHMRRLQDGNLVELVERYMARGAVGSIYEVRADVLGVLTRLGL